MKPRISRRAARSAAAAAGALVLHAGARAVVPTAAGGHKEYVPSAQLARRLPSKWPRPAWHPPWKMYRVVAGHLGWGTCPASQSTPLRPSCQRLTRPEKCTVCVLAPHERSARAPALPLSRLTIICKQTLWRAALLVYQTPLCEPRS